MDKKKDNNLELKKNKQGNLTKFFSDEERLNLVVQTLAFEAQKILVSALSNHDSANVPTLSLQVKRENVDETIK